MLLVRETTEWRDNTPNHYYLLSNDKMKMFAYMTECGISKEFKNPIDFYPKGRKFDIVEKYADQDKGIAVTGSKGDVYYVTSVNGEYKCTCVGFKYHGTCKHIEKVVNDLVN